MNLVILEGNLGTAPKHIGNNTYAIRIAVSENNNNTLWVDGLFFDSALSQGLASGTRVLINGRLTSFKENQKSPKILIDTIEIK